MELEVNGLVLTLDEAVTLLPERAAAALGLEAGGLADLRVVRRSLDARRARPPRFVYLVRLRLAPGVERPAGPFPAGVTVAEVAGDGWENEEGPSKAGASVPESRPVVIGGGPAGLFAALVLARRGLSPLLLERGKPVPERVRDVRAFWEEGVLDPESHVHFGEGGAGTFSDGKLTSRAKNPCTAWVKRILVEMGAPAEILVEARPHVGTDRLRAVVIRLRRHLEGLGAEVRFRSRVTGLVVRQGRVAAVVVDGREEIEAERVILACGQSADDTYRMLSSAGVAVVPKPFAIGVRVEHPQALVDRIQYGPWAGHPRLPAADYTLTTQIPTLDRAVYSFCMCPGGQVIGCSASPGGVITNGMSRCRRDGSHANSAVVVNVRPEDFATSDPLAGLDFRGHWEARAFAAGGCDYRAPAQRLTDFLAGRAGDVSLESTFRPGVRAAAMEDVLPSFVTSALREGLRSFESRMPGFVTAEALLIGVETRTSSPVRILRGEDGQSVSVTGLFPCGEGAGYAGGIISAALDGIRAATCLTERLDAAGRR